MQKIDLGATGNDEEGQGLVNWGEWQTWQKWLVGIVALAAIVAFIWFIVLPQFRPEVNDVPASEPAAETPAETPVAPESKGTLTFITYSAETDGYKIVVKIDERDDSTTRQEATFVAIDSKTVPHKVVLVDDNGDSDWERITHYQHWENKGWCGVVFTDDKGGHVTESAADDGHGRVWSPSDGDIKVVIDKLLPLLLKIEVEGNITSKLTATITDEIKPTADQSETTDANSTVTPEPTGDTDAEDTTL